MRLSFLLLLLPLTNCASSDKKIPKHNFEIFYKQYNVSGSFMLYDEKQNTLITYNENQLSKGYLPASTFKIVSSLIGLELGIVTDTTRFDWDSLIYSNPNWNKHQTMREAFKNSTVWWYQQLVQKIGRDRMFKSLAKLNYGNKDTTGGETTFWLKGGLKITPRQQLDLVRRLRNNSLPFSRQAMEGVKSLMVSRDTLGSIIREKTGWADTEDADIGWHVGYIESSKKNTYYFVNCIQDTNKNNSKFGVASKEITNRILNELNIFRMNKGEKIK